MNSNKEPKRIVIIDSGIDTSKSNLSEYVKKSTSFRINTEGSIIEDMELSATHPHGTIIAMIIRQLCPNVELTSINILNERLASNGNILLHAFNEALKLQPDIIHMSLGTTNKKYVLSMKRIIRAAARQKIIMVAAAENTGKKSYPAYLRGVMGVKADSSYSYDMFDFRNGFFYAPGVLKGIKGIEEMQGMEEGFGSSYAAAYITGHLARLLYDKRPDSLKNIIKELGF